MDRPARNDKLSYIIIGLLVVILGVQLFAMQAAETFSGEENAEELNVYRDRFFALAADDRLLMMTPVEGVGMPRPFFQRWVAEALTSSMSFTWFDEKHHYERVSEDFTEEGLEKFKAYHSSVIKELEPKQEVHSLSLLNSPEYTKSIDRDGSGSETFFEIPVIITYQAGARPRRFSAIVKLSVKQGYTPEGEGRWQIHDLDVTSKESL